MTDIISYPLKFVGATVLSFNSTLGLGSTESTLTVDLIEDCEAGDSFIFDNTDTVGVGAPAYFSVGSFNFGGIIQNWTVNQGNSGKTYKVSLVDPRQILANTTIITDTYLGQPVRALNYFNVYAYSESMVLNGVCSSFGSSQRNEAGMPYNNIIQALQSMNPIIKSPTGYNFIIDFSSFPTGLPEYYRITSTNISVLELLEGVCDALGYEFYVNLLPGGIITIGLINLNFQPSSFKTILSLYNGRAIDISYGQELRNEKTRNLIFGDNQHYITQVDNIEYFFGEDYDDTTQQYYAVYPYAYDRCGFWISKKITELNTVLNRPLSSNGPYSIHELDIRASLSSMELWLLRVFTPNSPGGLNAAIRANWPECVNDVVGAINNLFNIEDLVDVVTNPKKARAKINNEQTAQDLELIYNWLKNLANQYYGQQFLARLPQQICYYKSNTDGKVVYSEIPTNNGGWIDYYTSVLGLRDPELGLFRTEDERIQCFAVFNQDGSIPSSSGTGPLSSPSGIEGP